MKTLIQKASQILDADSKTDFSAWPCTRNTKILSRPGAFLCYIGAAVLAVLYESLRVSLLANMVPKGRKSSDLAIFLTVS